MNTGVRRRLFVGGDDNEIPSTSTDELAPNQIQSSTHQVAKTSTRKSASTQIQKSFSRGFTVPVSKAGSKRYFCIYCKTLTTKFARHISLVHKDESEVQALCRLPKNSQARKELIDKLRKQGTFEYNTSEIYNPEKQLIVARRPQANKNRNDNDYECCSNCNSFYSKLTLRHHFRICNPTSKKGSRDVLVQGRKKRHQVHEVASSLLRDVVLPILRDDEVADLIKRDKLLMIFGNKMLQKYRAQYHHKMIRSKLRCLGRLLLAMQKNSPLIKDFCYIYDPSHYDLLIKTINELAGLDETTGTYKAPSYAFMVGMLIKKIGHILVSECVKDKNHTMKDEVTNFLKLINEDFATSINKTVQENQLEAKRRKTISIPSVKDIQCLKKYLDVNREKYFNLLKVRFSFNSWKQLASYTLITLQLFNRRRAGEIERLMISDVEKCHGLNDGINDDLYNSLSSAGQDAANQYVRCVIRGKLAKGVPVLFHKHHYQCVRLIIEHRSLANVNDANPYVFGLPSTKEKQEFLSACVLMRQFASKCGAENPDSLRGTQLRKHIATQSVLLNLKETEVSDLANFMGHADKIHKDHYRLPIPAREIINISKLLEIAQGASADTIIDDEQVVESNFTTSNEPMEVETNSTTSNEPMEVETNCTTSNELIKVKTNSTTSKNKKVINVNSQLLPVVQLTPLKRVLRNCAKAKPVSPDLSDTPLEPFEWSPSSYHPTSESDSSEANAQQRLVNIKSRKITWNTPERAKARQFFKVNLESKVLPNLKECCKIAKNHHKEVGSN